jgi:hypothetical protein
LSAGNEDGDAVGEPDDHGARNEFDGSAETGGAHDDQEYSRHHRAHEQAIDAVGGDDARDYDHEGAGRAANLRFRSAQSGDQEAGDDSAVDASLRCQSGGDGEGHGKRQGDQADGNSGDQVEKEFVAVVLAEAKDGLRKQRRRCPQKLQAKKNQENFEKSLRLNSGRQWRPLFSPRHPLGRAIHLGVLGAEGKRIPSRHW